MKYIQDMEMETEKNKRKRTDEESDDEKQEKRQRLDSIIEKHTDVIQTTINTTFLETEIPTLDERENKGSAQTDPEARHANFAKNETKIRKEDTIFINQGVESEACSLPANEREKEDRKIEITPRTLSLDSNDGPNSEVVGKTDSIRSSLTFSETENNGESKCREIIEEESAFRNESDIEKDVDVNFDSAEEKETCIDNCAQLQVINSLEGEGISTQEADVQIKHIDASDTIENECNNSVSTTETVNQIVTIDESGQEDNVAEEKFLYRLLRPDESYAHGIKPKNVYSNTTIDYHVSNGSSDDVRSRYISCSKTRSGISNFAYLIRKAARFEERHIVRIDKTKLGDDCKIFDLTKETVRSEHLTSHNALKYSSRFDEVLLAPSWEIPVECFTKVATVQNRIITWKEDSS